MADGIWIVLDNVKVFVFDETIGLDLFGQEVQQLDFEWNWGFGAFGQ